MKAILLALLAFAPANADRLEETALRQQARCGEWHALALSVGWGRHHLARLDAVMWRESRCLPGAVNADDPHGGSIGLTQINRFWCLPNRYSPTGWLQSQGVLVACADLRDPATNLAAARAIHGYAEARHGDGWGPWIAP
jgi:hypothetical protein